MPLLVLLLGLAVIRLSLRQPSPPHTPFTTQPEPQKPIPDWKNGVIILLVAAIAPLLLTLGPINSRFVTPPAVLLALLAWFFTCAGDAFVQLRSRKAQHVLKRPLAVQVNGLCLFLATLLTSSLDIRAGLALSLAIFGNVFPALTSLYQHRPQRT